MDFVNNGKKISYAASFGKSFVLNEDRKTIKEYLKTFDSISVRENSGKKIIEDLGFKNCSVVADPVFLLDNEEYKKIAILPKKERYLLIYCFGKDALITPLARKIATQHNLKIVTIGGFLNRYKADYQIRTAGPKEFLGYFINADYVITNSFHGTAFSIIFNKNFVALKLHNNRGTRIESLLENCDLYNRLIGTEQDFENVIKPISYERVADKINRMVSSSKEFLKNSIK